MMQCYFAYKKTQANVDAWVFYSIN